MQNAIDTQFGAGKATVIDNGDGTFTVSFIDSKKDYNITSSGIENGVNWNTAMKEAKAPESQTTTSKSVIGVGTDGKPVNMDLWEYTLLSNNSYALNDENALSENSNYSASSGYKGTFVNGKITGTMPLYISEDGGKNFNKVTSLENTFRNCTELKDMPTIPFTVTNMVNTFCDCTNLTTTKSLPHGVTNCGGTFARTNIINSPKIPDTVTSMKYMFSRSSLEFAPYIPESVINLNATFEACTNLKSPPLKISSNVTNMEKTFINCYNLQGAIQIDANPEMYNMCFYNCSRDAEKNLLLYGESTMLETLYNTKSNNSKIEITSR